MITNNSNLKEENEEKNSIEKTSEENIIDSKNTKSKLSIGFANFKSKIIKFSYLTSTLIAWVIIILIISICICVGLKLI